MAFRVKDFDDIVTDMVSYIVANSDEISDLTPGSIIRSYTEAAALSLEELYVSTYLEFLRFMSTMKQQVFEFDRKEGTKATATVTFTRTGTSELEPIPEGTTVATGAGLEFVTTEQGSIADGNNNSDPVEVEATEVGTKYNVNTNSITTIVDDVDGVDGIDSSTAATGGVDVESDLQYSKRFQSYIEGLAKSNVSGLREGALSVEGITSVSVNEIFPPQAPSYQTVDLYIDDGSPTGVSSEKINTVRNIINGDGTPDNPGYRSAGINVIVKAPSPITRTISINVNGISGVDTSQVSNDIETQITSYVNSLGIGEDIILNELRWAAMDVFGVYDIEITDPTGNVTIGPTEVGRVADIDVTFI